MDGGEPGHCPERVEGGREKLAAGLCGAEPAQCRGSERRPRLEQGGHSAAGTGAPGVCVGKYGAPIPAHPPKTVPVGAGVQHDEAL